LNNGHHLWGYPLDIHTELGCTVIRKQKIIIDGTTNKRYILENINEKKEKINFMHIPDNTEEVTMDGENMRTSIG